MSSPLVCLTEVEWREVGEYSMDEPIWPRNRTCPDEGEVRWCQTHYSKWEEIALWDKRWLLFQTGQSLFNGVDSREELDALVLVEAEILGIKEGAASMTFGPDSQWLRVRCLQAIPFVQIPSRLPPIGTTDLNTSPPMGDADYSSENLFLYTNGGSQVTETAIYAGDAGVPTHLIFIQVSILNECWIYNWPVK